MGRMYLHKPDINDAGRWRPNGQSAPMAKPTQNANLGSCRWSWKMQSGRVMGDVPELGLYESLGIPASYMAPMGLKSEPAVLRKRCNLF